MNRREAIAALTALPAAAVVTRASVETDDVIIVECPHVLSQATASSIKFHMEKVWPRNKVVVLSDGVTIRIAKNV